MDLTNSNKNQTVQSSKEDFEKLKPEIEDLHDFKFLSEEQVVKEQKLRNQFMEYVKSK